VGRVCSTRGYKMSNRKPAEKRALERPRDTWSDNIEVVLRETGCDDVGWVKLTQGRD